ncbi:hypothetical protein [Nocardioides sp. LHG3406-4]|uniref:hypothetical protein n=1 Tax=Nocardioides sp. LHG3406-4 TaxID=2804575 RepID=UPI003CF06F20
MTREEEILAELAKARSEFNVAQADLRSHLDKMRARPLLSDDERKALEELAEKGRLDDDMTALVKKVKDGEDTWEAVFSGESPHGQLLHENLSQLIAAHGLEIAEAWEDLLDEEEEKGNYL